MVQRLPEGTRLTAIFDSPHSGSALELPYLYSTKGILREPSLAKEAVKGLLNIIGAYRRDDLGLVAGGFFGKGSKLTDDKDGRHGSSAPSVPTPGGVCIPSRAYGHPELLFVPLPLSFNTCHSLPCSCSSHRTQTDCCLIHPNQGPNRPLRRHVSRLHCLIAQEQQPDIRTTDKEHGNRNRCHWYFRFTNGGVLVPASW